MLASCYMVSTSFTRRPGLCTLWGRAALPCSTLQCPLAAGLPGPPAGLLLPLGASPAAPDLVLLLSPPHTWRTDDAAGGVGPARRRGRAVSGPWLGLDMGKQHRAGHKGGWLSSDLEAHAGEPSCSFDWPGPACAMAVSSVGPPCVRHCGMARAPLPRRMNAFLGTVVE